MSLITDDNDVEQRVSRALRSLTQRQYTLAELSALSREYIEAARKTWAENDVVEVGLHLSLWLAWLQGREGARS